MGRRSSHRGGQHRHCYKERFAVRLVPRAWRNHFPHHSPCRIILRRTALPVRSQNVQWPCKNPPQSVCPGMSTSGWSVNTFATAPGSGGTGFAWQNPGNETISPLFDHGVAVAMELSDARHACKPWSHPGVTSVSELNNTTLCRVARYPRLAVPTNPRLRALAWNTQPGMDFCAQLSSNVRVATSGEASSITITSVPGGTVAWTLCKQHSSSRAAL